MRQEEISAVGETIGILTSDEAQDAMTASMTFVQRRAASKVNAQAKAKVVESLAASGKALQSPRLSWLAIHMQNDAFAKVEDSLDGMVVQLSVEQKDEVEKKDGCVSDLNSNDKETTMKNGHKDDVETEITVLQTDIEAKKEEQEHLQQEIYEAQVQLKKSSENREEENKLFQQTISDQRATQAILQKAIDRMAEFYSKKRSGVRRSDPGARQGYAPPDSSREQLGHVQEIRWRHRRARTP